MIRRRTVQTRVIPAVPLVALAAVSILSGTFMAFLSSAALVAVALLVGTALLRVFHPPVLSFVERVVIAFGLGLGAIATSAFVLGAFGLLRLPVIVLLALGSVALAFRVVPRTWPSVPDLSRIDVALAWLIAGVLSASAPFVAAPETSWDAMWRHLPLARAFAEAGALPAMPYIEASASAWLLPQVTYAVAMLLGGLEAAKYVHALVGIASVLAVYCVGRRLSDRTTGLFAAVLWLSIPQVFSQLGKAYVDLFPSLYTTLVALVALVWWSARGRPLALLAGVLAGFGVAMKITAILTIVPLLAVVIAWARTTRERIAWAAAAGLAALVAAPGFIRTAAITAPLDLPFASVAPATPIGPPAAPTEGVTSPIDVVLAPLRLVLAPAPYCYSDRPCLGIVPPLLAAACLAMLWQRDVRLRGLGMVSLLGLGGWSLVAADARYLLPTIAVGIPLLARVVMGVFPRVPLPVRTGGVIVAGLAVMVVVLFQAGGADRLPLRVALGLETRTEYLHAKVRYLSAYDWIAAAGQRSPRAILNVGWGEASVVYSPTPMWMAEATLPGRAILEASSDAERVKLLRDGGFDYVLIDRTVSDDLDHPFARFARSSLRLAHTVNGVAIYEVP